MEKRFKLVYLLDIYGGLLTDKQFEVLNRYYNEDLSLTEIASFENVSRQAAFDLLKRAEKLLISYDDKLHLFEKYMQNRDLIGKIKENLNQHRYDVLLQNIDVLEKNI